MDGFLVVVAVFFAGFVPIHAKHPDHLEYDKIATIDAVPKHRSFACKVEYRPHKRAVAEVDRRLLASDLLAA